MSFTKEEYRETAISIITRHLAMQRKDENQLVTFVFTEWFWKEVLEHAITAKS